MVGSYHGKVVVTNHALWTDLMVGSYHFTVVVTNHAHSTEWLAATMVRW
jgi:hypothetical protein